MYPIFYGLNKNKYTFLSTSIVKEEVGEGQINS